MDKLLTTTQVSEITGISTGTLAQYRYLGTGPKYRQLAPRTIRYTLADIEAWVEKSARSRTDQTSAPVHA